MNNNESVNQNSPSSGNSNVNIDNASTTLVNTNQTNNVTNSQNSTLQEVSVNVDSSSFNKIDENEVSKESVFNQENSSSTTDKPTTTLKEGEETAKTKKGFPFFMLIIFILFIISPFFLDEIMEYLNNFGSKNKTPIQEQNIVKIVSLDEIKKALDQSKSINKYMADNNVKINISVNNDKLIVLQKNLFDEQNPNDISVEFNLKDNVLTAMCNYDNSDFGLEISKIIIKQIALIQGVDSSKVDKYVDNNLYTLTIDKGFELTHSKDGNNIYKIANNVKLAIE